MYNLTMYHGGLVDQLISFVLDFINLHGHLFLLQIWQQFDSPERWQEVMHTNDSPCQ